MVWFYGIMHPSSYRHHSVESVFSFFKTNMVYSSSACSIVLTFFLVTLLSATSLQLPDSGWIRRVKICFRQAKTIQIMTWIWHFISVISHQFFLNHHLPKCFTRLWFLLDLSRTDFPSPLFCPFPHHSLLISLVKFFYPREAILPSTCQTEFNQYFMSTKQGEVLDNIKISRNACALRY